MLDLKENREAVDRLATQWTSFIAEAHPVERTEVIKAVQEFYTAHHKPTPQVIVCQSPWQLIMMKILLQRRVDEKQRSAFAQPSKDPFLPQQSRWLWRELLRTYDEQVTVDCRERLALNKNDGGKDFWSSAFKSVVADFSFVGPWSKLSPGLFGDQEHFHRQIGLLASRAIGQDAFDTLLADYAAGFPFASTDRVFSVGVSRELVEHAIGNQPLEVKGQVIANLMSPVVSSVFRSLISTVDLELSSQEQTEHELKLLGMMTINELVYTRSIVGKLPLLLFLSEKVAAMKLPPEELRRLKATLRLCRATPVLLTYEGVCLASSQPDLQKCDAAFRLHADDGPAVSFSDGFQIYSWNGVRVTRSIIESPADIKVDQILRERNVEMRRILMERFGHARFLQECGAKKIHEDKFGVLYRKALPPPEEPLLIVKVKNSTPEPDGTFRDYFLRVPPNVTTAKAAVAWTFNVPEKDYCPDAES